ncbi:WD40 repeat domain-containing protein [Galbibacter pacificus]|uniref:WD40 repeat domain-containing protein n=1 Tax=Galbibacter pacificus TaxID=2996052 RepID=A0ABT6FN70_9FLAO|nr:WD40 repeat domain-containing protein [Galbibacter pacificus]MDG3581240.1 WD40 repeat domain-containing protein [Galbibacter pacificus]MDG3584718.1 WD40 repeat domain-containing protein [Galbibacter pacificus]
MKFYKIATLVFLSLLFTNCKQRITIKKSKFTGINPVSYTDVVFTSSRDTVFVSTYDGKIYELINQKNNRKQIAAIDDEIYNMAYNAEKNEVYAATLHLGIVVINTLSGALIKKIPLKASWAYQLCYNQKNGILATFDFKGNHYIWDTENDFKQLDTPAELKQMRPKHITDNGDIYFDGRMNKILVWNYKTNEIKQHTIKGKLADVDSEANFLLIDGKEFGYYNTASDSLYYSKKHPDWPIYLADKDTTVNVPLNLEVITGLMTKGHLYTYGLDKSIRKWNKPSGAIVETYSKHRATPSAMDITQDRSQLVTVDLKGGIEFWDL